MAIWQVVRRAVYSPQAYCTPRSEWWIRLPGAGPRAGFRDALDHAKDNNAIKQAAKEQAGFSSERETQCRDYAGESTFGFCAARITQARAFALRAKTAQLAAAGVAEKVQKPKKKK